MRLVVPEDYTNFLRNIHIGTVVILSICLTIKLSWFKLGNIKRITILVMSEVSSYFLSMFLV